jgi:uncharacterized protein
MTPETLERVIRQASEYETVWFIWHGGEPLTLPLKFYKNALDLQEKYFGRDTHRISNTIQTNGVSMDKRYMSFCKDRKINVGISFEGPYNHLLREGTDTVQRNLDMMRKGGHMFSVSSTICRESTDRQTELYRHFVKNGIALSLSPVIRLGWADEDMIPYPDEYADASIEAFTEWLYDTEAEMPLMPHMNYLMSALGDPSPSDCAHSSCITKWICVYPNGDLYPCARGCPSEFRLCNTADIEHMSDAFRSDAMKELLIPLIERRDTCASECDLFGYCNGGCPIDALSEGSITKRNGDSCMIFKKVFGHILNVTENILCERPDLSRYNKFVREAIIGKMVNPATDVQR